MSIYNPNIKYLMPFVIPLSLIKSTVPRSHFSEELINKLAEQSLKVGGVVRPAIIKRVDLNSYEVVHGFLAYYVGMRAQEIDEQAGRNIVVYVVDPNNEDPIMTQIDLFTYPVVIN
jgi:hypothetical protein